MNVNADEILALQLRLRYCDPLGLRFDSHFNVMYLIMGLSKKKMNVNLTIFKTWH